MGNEEGTLLVSHTLSPFSLADEERCESPLGILDEDDEAAQRRKKKEADIVQLMIDAQVDEKEVKDVKYDTLTVDGK